MVIGITRVRNESLILADTLTHFSQFVDEIHLYDDFSTDDTIRIAKSFDIVTKVIEGDRWRSDRVAENTRHRKLLFESACRSGADWVLCFDADERLCDGYLPPLSGTDAMAFTFRLFDGYMTPEHQEPYTGGELIELPRLWGPEYRDIVMLFRANELAVKWNRPGMRQPNVRGLVLSAPVQVRHYGKCLSVEHWEETCDYYIKHFPKWRQKWERRKGKAIHEKSDFGLPLYPWSEVREHGVKL